MKQYKYLYQKMTDEDIIRQAYKRLRKGKTKRTEIQIIDANLDAEVETMKQMIINTKPPDVSVEHPELAYVPCKRIPKTVYEHGKTRTIYMPEIHEQWLHHVIVMILEPIVMATAFPFSCGSFPKRGAHYGKRHIEKFIRKGKDIKYFAKLDIHKFYNSIRMDILMRELRIRIKDEWFLYVIKLCYKGFEKGMPLGFYISQWLANYLMEPLDRLITEELGLKNLTRYMDDIVIFDDNKKRLHKAVIKIKQFIGRRFRLKVKSGWQVCRFDYVKKNGKRTGRALDYMGFLFFRTRTTIRKNIMLTAVRTAHKLAKEKAAKRGYYKQHISAMLSLMGWFDCTDSYHCYEIYIKPVVKIGDLKKIISKLDRRANDHDRLDERNMLIAA